MCFGPNARKLEHNSYVGLAKNWATICGEISVTARAASLMARLSLCDHGSSEAG